MIMLFMWIFAQLWRTTYNANGQSVISGLTLQETMWYLMVAETIILSQPNIAMPISQNVKDGSIAYILGKPYNFILYQFSISFGDSLLLVITNMIAGGVVVWGLVGSPPDMISWPMVIATMLLALIIHFCMNVMIGLMAFITEEISAFLWIHNKFLLILGGVLIPLDFFPDWLLKISNSLPFAHIVYGPARLFVDPDPERFFRLILFQISWFLIISTILTIMYRKIVARLVINGG
jgi:ABC-2 type transport system permease protein